MVCLALSGGAAVAAKAPKEPQKDRAAADALFTQSNVLHLRLEIAKPGLDSLRKNPRKYVKATLREGDAVYEDVGIHLKGSAGSFRQVDDRPGLTFNMAAFEASSKFHGLRKFHLNNSVQDASCLSEFVSGELFRAAGVPAARAGLALVELNGRKLGLYVFLESMDRDFLARDFHNTKGNLYGQAGGCEITDAIERMEGRGPLDRADLKGLAAAINEPNPAKRWERVQKALDVDRFLSFMALEVMLCHWDGYTFARHNYRVYHDLDTDRMVFIPHDLDQLMQDSNVPIVPDGNGWVSKTMVRTPETRDRYRERFRAIFTNYFVVSALTNRINQRVAQVLPVLKAADAGLA
ncbi:MAG: CotH kinase family protein [Verrucomicrobia bacterium]|nr:CotH kinase family protein [Verrucomicrobiota bacterium]